MHIETLFASATQPNTGAAIAATTGDSLNVKAATPGTAVRALAIWTHHQASGFIRLLTPSGHDNATGYTVHQPAGIHLVAPLGTPFPFQPQETISGTISGSNTAGDVESVTALMLYEDLPGIDTTKRLMHWDEVRRKAVRPVTIKATITPAGAGYSAEELITAETNNLRAQSNYALLGITSSVDTTGVYIKGADTGYQRVAVPGMASKTELTSNWFASLSRIYDMPLIPVINSGNKDSTYIGVINNETTTATNVSLHLVLLNG